MTGRDDLDTALDALAKADLSRALALIAESGNHGAEALHRALGTM